MILLVLAFLIALPASAQQIEPEEPDIILPEVILRIEDFSVENVESGLPAEEELAPPVREVPLPERQEIAIAEPQAPLGLEAGGELPPEQRGYTLAAQAELGAGTMNHLFSQVSLFRMGEEPRFKFKFLHETFDGIAGQPPGAGFNQRQDSLEGALKFRLGSLSIDAEGELREDERGLKWRDDERGLQWQGPFISRVFRQGAGRVELSYPIGSLLTLGVAADSSFASQLLTGASPQAVTEILASPLLSARLSFPRFWFGLEGRYKYRELPETSGESVHRAAVQGSFGVDILDTLRLEGSGGWFYSSLLGHLFPFSLDLSGTLFSFLSFRAAGGYRMEEIDVRNLLSQYPLVELPGTLLDNHGWFADLGVGLSLARSLSLQTRALAAWNSGLPDPRRDVATSTGLDPLTGLFPLGQEAGIRLDVEAQLRWTLGRLLAVSGGMRMDLLQRPGLAPATELRLDAEGKAPSGRWGGRGSLVFLLGYPPGEPAFTLMPVLDASGYYKVSEAISLIAEARDLLHPLIGGPRYSWYPFMEPGLRGTFKVQINL